MFGVIEGTRALYCGEHASDDHVDVRHKKCGEYKGSIVPCFCTHISIMQSSICVGERGCAPSVNDHSIDTN